MCPCDYQKYPSNWKSEIVPRILTRANNRCEICGIENRSEVHSCKIRIATGKGKAGYYQIWFTEKSDTIRIKHLTRWMIKKIRVILTVAHLDHDEQNQAVSDDRLMAMCQKCHLAYDADEKKRRKILR